MNRYLAFVMLALLAACGEGDKKPGAGPAAGPGAAPPPPEVEVLIVATGAATLTQDLPGRLMAIRSAQVRARVEGVVEKRLFAEGSDIAAGTPLFRIDARTYQANLSAAEADLASAAASFSRLKPLLEIKAVSQQEYDQASARHKQAEAEIQAEVLAAQKEAEAHGTLHVGGKPSVRDVFEGVYAEMPPHLRKQRQQAGV